MSDIPEDVMKAAHAVRDKTCADAECTFDAGCGCLDAIARAIMAERERCAEIAEGNSRSFNFQKALAECRDNEHGYESGRLAAAEAIRRGN